SVLVGAPLCYLLLVMASNRFFCHHSLGRVRIAHYSGILVALVWFQDAHHEIAGWDKSHEDYRLAENPHYTMAVSCLNELFGSSAITLNEPFPAEYLGDFQTVGEQPGTGQPTPGLARGPKNVIVVV